MTKKVIRKAVKKSTKLKHKTTVDGLKSDLRLKPASSLPRYKCKNPKCKHEWIPRINAPMVCPRCHRAYAG